MNSSRLKLVFVLLVFSLVLNLGLANLLRARRAAVPPPSAPTQTDDAKPAGPQERLPSSRPLAIAGSKAGMDDFQWSSVESPDYKVYIANLRRIGCPEETIRDVIIADLNKGYHVRMNAVAAQGRSVAFWRSDSERNKYLRTLEHELKNIEREKQAVVKELLGVPLPETVALDAARLLNQELTYGFLAPEKAELVRSLFQRHQDQEREIGEKSGGWMTEEDQAALRAVRAKREAELAELLSPAELDEYKMRNSSTAQNVRNRTDGMDLSEDEFRKLYAVRKAYDDATALLTSEQRNGEERQRLRQQRDEQMKNLLGDQRYTQYERSQDFEYQNLTQLASRFKLPSETVNSAYEINRAAQEQMNRLASDRSLDSARRKDALAAIAAETQQELKRTLGPVGYEAYRARGSGISFSPNGSQTIRTVVSGQGGGDIVLERRVLGDTPPTVRP